MDTEGRRRQILEIITAQGPVTGAELSRRLGVSRQVIVQDVAILRARGQDILATASGYTTPEYARIKGCVRTFICRHGLGDLEKELMLIVRHNGRVLDVVVEHPVYGELRGLLMLSTPEEVKRFTARLLASGAQPLLALTRGVHVHTVEAATEEDLNTMEAALEREGLLFPAAGEGYGFFMAQVTRQ
ncbi:MAG: transcription repressor NadR [Clostridia bacterium]|nr:MAG: transcription repressor NadR [Clostridia bacterium]